VGADLRSGRPWARVVGAFGFRPPDFAHRLGNTQQNPQHSDRPALTRGLGERAACRLPSSPSEYRSIAPPSPEAPGPGRREQPRRSSNHWSGVWSLRSPASRDLGDGESGERASRLLSSGWPPPRRDAAHEVTSPIALGTPRTSSGTAREPRVDPASWTMRSHRGSSSTRTRIPAARLRCPCLHVFVRTPG
jgi:hypothetical protein